MNYIICPKCSFENKTPRLNCFECGEVLAGGKVIKKEGASSSYGNQTPRSRTSSSGTTPQPRVTPPSQKIRFENKYSALRAIANFCQTIAIIMVVVAGIIGFVGLIFLFDKGAIGLVIIVFAAIFGVSGYVFYKVLAESIFVILDIEANTRQSAAYLRNIMDNR